MNVHVNADLKQLILEYSRQNKIGELSPWFNRQLDKQIKSGQFKTTTQIQKNMNEIIAELARYREENQIENVVIGMSGGVDSALTAALFKQASWNVLGVTMPINQNPEETDRGQEAIKALGITGEHIDLSTLYTDTLKTTFKVDSNIYSEDKSAKIRRGNIRARLRMITLYNLAAAYRGLVASTDNYSELGAGFWTLHGDVGDVAPIQMLLKSWEVPLMAMFAGVPESTYRATPTDGLGIDAGDEAQLGASYLEWDLMVNAIYDATNEYNITDAKEVLKLDAKAEIVFNNVTTRMNATRYKRANPYNLVVGNWAREVQLNAIDNLLKESN